MSAAPGATGFASPGALRANVVALLVMLVVESALGAFVNVSVALPAADHGRPMLAAWVSAITAGPPALAVHAAIGVLLAAGALTYLARAALAGRGAGVALGLTGVVAIAAAALSGARFVGGGQGGASLTMALAAAVAQTVYLVALVKQ